MSYLLCFQSRKSAVWHSDAQVYTCTKMCCNDAFLLLWRFIQFTFGNFCARCSCLSKRKKDVRWFSLPHDDNIILIIARNKVSAGVIKIFFFWIVCLYLSVRISLRYSEGYRKCFGYLYSFTVIYISNLCGSKNRNEYG